MASLSFTQFLSPSRWHLNSPCPPSGKFVQLQGFRLHKREGLLAAGRRKLSESSPIEEEGGNGAVERKKTSRSTRTGGSRTRKKEVDDTAEENAELAVNNEVSDEKSSISDSNGKNPRTPRRTRKAAVGSSDMEEEITEKKVRKKRVVKKKDAMEDLVAASDLSDHEDSTAIEIADVESEEEIDLEKYEAEDISDTYGWPPLVCCFGSAQHAFVPSGRPANRLMDYEIHERRKDASWAPEKFVRAPGGCAGGVAIALAKLGGKVAFMGKLGDDDYGQAMLYFLNVCNVQTRSVRIDGKRPTAISMMKIGKRGRLKLSCIKPCAEDSLSKPEINIDVLKESKMFYFSTQSLLDRKMRSTTLQAIKISKRFGSVIFYDVNLPLPLWESSEETKALIQQFWDLADIVEVTKQELEFLCGIKPSEEFDTKNNDCSKFIHYEPETIKPLWHENLKVLFMTNGTSKVHYYTKEHNGAVLGMEDVPMTPFTSDMSASGDGIVAGLMRMLVVQPDLINDKEFLERTIRYGIECGIVDQWLVAQTRGFPPRDDMEEDEVEPDEFGIRSITELEFNTVKSASEMSDMPDLDTLKSMYTLKSIT